MPWIWVGLIELDRPLLGLIILVQWAGLEPLHTRLFLGIDLIFASVGWVAVGFGLGRRA